VKKSQKVDCEKGREKGRPNREVKMSEKLKTIGENFCGVCKNGIWGDVLKIYFLLAF
jgi:hypothetical protein